MATQAPFMVIGGVPVYVLEDGSYCWLGGFDVDGDGSGGNLEGDPDFQDQTSYKNPDGSSLNARTERFGVVPGVLIRAIPGIVLGCQGRILDVVAGTVSPFVCGDRGPDSKISEGSICLASFMGVVPNPVNGGTEQPRFFWQIWPSQPANFGGKQYRLQPS